MATLVIPWYRSSSERHNSEMLGALFANLRAPGVERVLLVSEHAFPSLADEKLEFVRTPSRPSWWDLFELVRDEGPFAICNADCAVVDLRHVSAIRAGECLWVTRWDPRGKGRYALARYGADLFGFVQCPDEISGHEGFPGEYGGDTRLALALEAAGYSVFNRPCAVPIIHFHAERSEVDELSRPGLDQPCEYDCVASGEYPSQLWRESITPWINRSPPYDYPVKAHATG